VFFAPPPRRPPPRRRSRFRPPPKPKSHGADLLEPCPSSPSPAAWFSHLGAELGFSSRISRVWDRVRWRVGTHGRLGLTCGR
jgi:hypothetical protein